MEDTNELLIKSIMKNSDLDDFVVIEDGLISDSEKEEIISEKVEEGQTAICRRVDLVKVAYMYIQGYDSMAISKVFGVTDANIRMIKGSEKFKAILSMLNNEIVSTARTFLTASGMKAVLTLLKCMDSKDDRTKLKASTEVLDRIGLKTPEQIEIIQKGDKIAQMGEEELLAFVKSGMKEIKATSKGVEDGAYQLETT